MSRRRRPLLSNDETKTPIERADHLAQQAVADFHRTALLQASCRGIAAQDTLVLSDRDRAVFFDALINPPCPNDRLKAALAEHARRVEQPRQR